MGVEFADLPNDVILLILEEVPSVRDMRVRKLYVEDYLTKINLARTSTYYYDLLMPRIWAYSNFVLFPNMLESFILSATSNGKFGREKEGREAASDNALGRLVSHLTFQRISVSDTEQEKHLPAARRVFSKLAGCGPSDAPPSDITADSSPYDLIWMTLTVCPSPVSLRIVPYSFACRVAPTVKARLPLPPTWDRLEVFETHIERQEVACCFDHFGNRSAIRHLRELKVSVKSVQDGMPQYATTPMPTSDSCSCPARSGPEPVISVDHVSINNNVVSSGLMSNLMASCQPRRLTAALGTFGWNGLGWVEAFQTAIPDSVNTLVLIPLDGRGWCYMCRLPEVSYYPTIRRLSMPMPKRGIVEHLPVSLSVLHLPYPRKKKGGEYGGGKWDWAGVGKLRRLDQEKYVQDDIDHEITDLNGVLVAIEDVLKLTGGPRDLSLHFASQIEDTAELVNVLEVPAPDIATPECLVQSWKERMKIRFCQVLYELQRIIQALTEQNAVKVFVPRTSFLCILIQQPHVWRADMRAKRKGSR